VSSNNLIVRFTGIIFLLTFLSSCAPKEALVLKGMNDILVETAEGDVALLKAQAVFFNPNNTQMRLREINVDVFVNGKKTARADQLLNSVIPAKAQFSVPLEVRLSLKEFGLFDTLMNLIGGKKYEIHYFGFVRVRVHGITVKVPIDYKDQLKLKI
jgi:LEA14-like dessication related protein